MYPFSCLSWMREARSLWLMWELLHPSNKERSRGIRTFLNIHEILAQHNSLLSPQTSLWSDVLKIHTEWNKEMLKQSHSPKLHKWDVCSNRVILPMTQDLDMVKFVEHGFWSISKHSRADVKNLLWIVTWFLKKPCESFNKSLIFWALHALQNTVQY